MSTLSPLSRPNGRGAVSNKETTMLRVLVLVLIIWPHPWADPRHPFHWIWLSGLWSDTPRHSNDNEPAPGGAGDIDLPPH